MMTVEMMRYKQLATCATCIVVVTIVLSVEAQQQLNNTQQTYTQTKDLWPVVNVDKQVNKSRVDVHIPIFFDMKKDDDDTGRSQLDLSVLSGLVTVNRDKARGPNGQLTGPLTVTVFGIPVYTGRAIAPAIGRVGSNNYKNNLATNRSEESLPSQANKLNISAITQSLGAITAENPISTSQIYSTVRKTNEKVLYSLANMLSRMASLASQQAEPISNINGRAADKSDGFVVASKFSRSDLEPKSPKILANKSDSAHESLVYV